MTALHLGLIGTEPGATASIRLQMNYSTIYFSKHTSFINRQMLCSNQLYARGNRWEFEIEGRLK